MICFAKSSCSLPDAFDSFELRAAYQARARHLFQLHPRPVAASAHLLRFTAR
jgi:hypothetical protein